MVDSFFLHEFIVIYQEAIVPYNNKVLYDESYFFGTRRLQSKNA